MQDAKKEKTLSPEEYEKIVKPHFESLYSGKYDLLVNPDKDSTDSPVNISLILRILCNSVGKIATELNLDIEGSKRPRSE